MGITEYNQMIFDLNHLIQPMGVLEQLELPFTKEEVERVVISLPNNKSPGLDGFINEFIKGCWPLLAADFMQLCENFHRG